MKKLRDHLIILSVVCIGTLGVVLAQDQAPAAGGGVPPPAPITPRRPTSTITPLPHRAPVKTPTVAPVIAPTAAASEGAEPRAKTTTPGLKFDNTPSDLVLAAYAQETGKTLLIAPDVPKANITLKSQPDVALNKEEFIEAIEVVLSMNGIVLEPFGEKFVKVLARKTVRTDGIRIEMDAPEGGYPEKTKVVSQMIQLKAIAVAEAQKAVEGFKKPDGLIQVFERTNSMLVTDTQENVNRMMEIIKFIDQPLVVLEEVNVRPILYAKAEEIKKRIEEVVAESQKQTQAKDEVKANPAGAPGVTRTAGTSSSLITRPPLSGLTRLGVRPATTPSETVSPNETLEALVSDADRGTIRGKVQILADERTNKLIIITRPDNMRFFDQIITVLDVETAPDVKVVVQRLEYADAEEVATMLNDLIGNATAKKDDKSAAAKNASNNNSPSEAGRSTSLAEAVAARAAARTSASESSSAEPGKSKLGQLSKENIKILSDKRTNAIIMMGSISDLAAIQEVIKGMDIQLSQVLIETVVLQVELGADLRTGMDWVIGKQANNYQFRNGDQAAGGGGSGSSLLGSLTDIAVSMATNSSGSSQSSIIGSGINYFLKSDKLNISALIQASKTDSRTKVLSSPVLLTVDNKEATIEATAMRYLYKGVRSTYGGSYGGYSEVPDFEQREIGLTVKVTPRINPNGTVVLTIDETFETIGADQDVNGQKYPTVNKRKVAADVSVDNMQTVVLGGLVQNEAKTSEGGIPLLKDIPWVGKYLFGNTTRSDTRSELLVFMTPYVLKTSDEALQEAKRRKEALHDNRPWDDNGWSASQLADPVGDKDRLNRALQKWASEDDERAAREKYDKAVKAREDQQLKRAKVKAEAEAKRGERTVPASSVPEIGVMKATDSVRVLVPEEKKP